MRLLVGHTVTHVLDVHDRDGVRHAQLGQLEPEALILSLDAERDDAVPLTPVQ